MAGKRGTIVQTTLISILIVLMSAAIIFFFLKALPYKEQVDIEACHNSVILRDNAILRGEGPLPEIPLNCKTQEIEIATTNKDTIQREIANQMYNCWWMLGEGKMNFFSESSWKEFGLGNVKSSCVICSNIMFDEKLKEKNLRLDMASYIEQTRIPTKNMTYLEYFTDEKDAVLPTDVEAPEITTDKDYVILFMSMEGDELWEPIAKDLGVVASSIVGSTFLIGPKATGSLLKSAGGLMKTGFTIGAKTQELVLVKGYQGWLTTPTAGSKVGGLTVKLGWVGVLAGAALVATQTIWTANNQAIVAQHCDGSKKGCSQVMLIPMNAANLSGVCNNIESIP